MWGSLCFLSKKWRGGEHRVMRRGVHAFNLAAVARQIIRWSPRDNFRRLLSLHVTSRQSPLSHALISIS